MDANNLEFKELIYYLMIGAIDLDKFPYKESDEVVNEYSSDKECEKAYDQVYNAKCRICERFKTDEDEDVECIISNLSLITRHLCMKMYEYGGYYAPSNDRNIRKLVEFYCNIPEEKKNAFMRILEPLGKFMKNAEESK